MNASCFTVGCRKVAFHDRLLLRGVIVMGEGVCCFACFARPGIISRLLFSFLALANLIFDVWVTMLLRFWHCHRFSPSRFTLHFFREISVSPFYLLSGCANGLLFDCLMKAIRLARLSFFSKQLLVNKLSGLSRFTDRDF